tara:strand:- start:424 stop:846 length:423 start_codon:yes stop_codon:yes gene_type:complete
MNSIAVRESRIGLMLPNDLIEFIWSLNYDSSAKCIQKYCQKYIQYKIQEIHDMLKFAHHKLHFALTSECLVKFKLFYRNRVMDREEVFNIMKSCRCCNRHQKDKPTTIKPWIDTDMSWNQTIYCPCPCRHISRMICRSCR